MLYAQICHIALWDTGLQHKKPEYLKISLQRWYIDGGQVKKEIIVYSI